MEASTIGGYQIIPSANHAVFLFPFDAKKQGHVVDIAIEVFDNSADLNFIWLHYSQYLIWHEWFVQHFINSNQYLSRPALQTEREYRSTKFKETFDLSSGKSYALILDNTYSQIRGKRISITFTSRWNTMKPPKSMPVVNKEI